MPEIIESTGDIFESGCRALVNAVDCTGAQGKGLAKTFAGRFPSARDAYRRRCNDDPGMEPGDVWAYHAAGVWLLFAATKGSWRLPSRLEWVERSLANVAVHVNIMGIKSVAVPALGCGLGGLDWTDVRPLIMTAAERMRCERVVVFAPQ
jgi:O-acetyl-ADP-ribose deacetylase (regulator of RNase III)